MRSAHARDSPCRRRGPGRRGRSRGRSWGRCRGRWLPGVGPRRGGAGGGRAQGALAQPAHGAASWVWVWVWGVGRLALRAKITVFFFSNPSCCFFSLVPPPPQGYLMGDLNLDVAGFLIQVQGGAGCLSGRGARPRTFFCVFLARAPCVPARLPSHFQRPRPLACLGLSPGTGTYTCVQSSSEGGGLPGSWDNGSGRSPVPAALHPVTHPRARQSPF